MSIANKLAKPVVEIIDHIAQKVPKGLGHGHHRIADHVHSAADHFDNVEDDLANKAKSHHHGSGGDHHDPHVPAGTGTAAAAKAGADKSGKAASDAVKDAEHEGDKVRPGEHGDRDSRPPDERHCETDPVDVASGEMIMPVVDVYLPGALPLVLARTHLSSYRNGGWFGRSWASTLDQRLQLDERGVVYLAPDGMRLEYPPPQADAPVLPVRGPRLALAWSGLPNEPMTVMDPRSGQAMEFDHPRPAPGETGAVVLRLVAIEDRNHRRIEIEWSDDDLPVAVSHYGGYRVAIDHHPDLPRIAALRLLDTDGPGTSTTLARYGYDAAGNVDEIVNSSGQPLRLTYDERGRVTAWTDRAGTVYTYTYDEAGRVVRTTGTGGVLSSSFAYDDATHTTRFTDSLGNTSVHEHNDAYRLVRSTDPLGNVTCQEWSEDNRLLTAVTDPLGRVTRFEYDAAANISAVVQPDGSRSTFSYDTNGQPVGITDHAGRVWRTEYDGRGNRLASVDPLGARTEYAYSDSGDLTNVVGPLGAQQHMTTDAAGLPVSVTDTFGNVTTARRDAFGRIVESTDALGNTVRFGWTTEGQVTWCERADGRRETWSFDAEGNVVAHTSPGEAESRLQATHFDLVAEAATGDGTSYAFAYDTEKRLTRVTNPLGQNWTYTYDAAGRLIHEQDFDGRTVDYAYDAAGQLVSRSNAGEQVTFGRDVLGRVTTHTDGASTTRYTYDAEGNLQRSANEHAEIVREHDLLGRIVGESVNGRRITYAYDLLGRRTERRTPSGVVSTWTYDQANMPMSLELAGHRTSFTYDAVRHETARHIDDALALTQDWDSTGRITRRSLTSGTPQANATVLERRYTYRADDLLAEIHDMASGTRRFGLDTAGRITAVTADGWTETYAYDALGNVIRAAGPGIEPADAERDFDGVRLRRAGRTSYEYDAQGRTVRTIKRLLDGRRRVRTFAWNAYDQLVATVTPDGEQWRYLYDPAGRRMAKQRLDARGGGGEAAVAEEVRFTWDLVCLAEQTTADDATTTWEYTPGSYSPLAQIDGGAGQDDETDRRFHAIVTDLVGTPTEMITPAGEVVWRQSTTVWGRGAAAGGVTPSGRGPSCPLRFPGQYADDETGWHHNYFRHYDPATGRYTSPDPLGLRPAPNPVAYVPNPTALVDPLGLAHKPNLPGWNGPEPVDVTWGGNVVYGPLDGHGRPTGVTARIDAKMLGQNTDPQISFNKMPGWDDQGRYNRTHLLAASLGGSNTIPENFVTAHRYANHPVMYHYEGQVARAVANGDHPNIDYKVTPVYRYTGEGPMRPEDLRPIGMMIEAHSRDGNFEFTPYDTKGAHRQELLHGPDGKLNRVLVLNVPKCAP